MRGRTESLRKALAGRATKETNGHQGILTELYKAIQTQCIKLTDSALFLPACPLESTAV